MSADVCVVGAGPAGLTLAHELADAGVDVLVLEAGPAAPPAAGLDITSTRSIGLPYDPAVTRSAGVGGSSVRWTVETPLGGGFGRLRELDARDLDGRDDPTRPGWPVSSAELAPFYRHARELLGLPTGEAPSIVSPGGLERHVYSFAHRNVFTERLPAGLRRHPRVRLLADSPVTEVLLEPGSGAVRGLRCRPGGADELVVVARAYVLAGGALENARLLLASRSTSPNGVGNAHDQVGRHFMEHPHFYSGVVVPRPGGPGPLATSARWDVVVRDGHPVQDTYAAPADLLRREGLLSSVYKVKVHRGHGVPGFGHDGDVPQAVVDAYGAVRAATRSRDLRYVSAGDVGQLVRAAPLVARYAWSRSLARRATAHGGPGPAQGGFRVHVMAEQEPSARSRLRLTDELDDLGVPKAELDWRLSRRDTESMVRGQRLVAGALGDALGARVISTMSRDGLPSPQGGAHHMGTTRMSTRPADGVVDGRCRVHGVPSLYLAGSSVFPTGGAANPTLTIVALAVRLARHLAHELDAVVIHVPYGAGQGRSPGLAGPT